VHLDRAPLHGGVGGCRSLDRAGRWRVVEHAAQLDESQQRSKATTARLLGQQSSHQRDLQLTGVFGHPRPRGRAGRCGCSFAGGAAGACWMRAHASSSDRRPDGVADMTETPLAIDVANLLALRSWSAEDIAPSLREQIVDRRPASASTRYSSRPVGVGSGASGPCHGSPAASSLMELARLGTPRV
jgi:hypothetical protein